MLAPAHFKDFILAGKMYNAIGVDKAVQNDWISQVIIQSRSLITCAVLLSTPKHFGSIQAPIVYLAVVCRFCHFQKESQSREQAVRCYNRMLKKSAMMYPNSIV